MTADAAASARRIQPLDGFRALAIVLVMGFHYLSFQALNAMPTLYPFGDRYARIPWLEHGNLGVDLFFMISGFVIAMTLESSRGPLDFAIKRLARLLPAMLLCSLLTYGFLMAWPTPAWSIAPIDFLPGWTFISDRTWSDWLGRRVGLVDGVYWTLFVEAKFYVLAAVLYFGTRRLPLLVSTALILNLMWLAVRLSGSSSGVGSTVIEQLKTWLLWNHLPAFAAGIAFSSLHRGQRKTLAWFVVLETVAMAVARTKFNLPMCVFQLAFFALFAALLWSPRLLAPFAWRPMAAVGACSYSLYLLHNRIGVSSTYHLGSVAPEWLRQSPLLPLVVGSVLMLVALGLYRYWEVPSRRVLLRWTIRPPKPLPPVKNQLASDAEAAHGR